MRYSELTENMAKQLEHNASLNQVLSKLRTNAFANAMFVFGSVATGKESPGDVDVVVDMTAYTLAFDPVTGTMFDPGVELAPLVKLMRECPYGTLDVFVKFKDALLVRNNTSTGFVKAKQAKQLWISMQQTMRSLSEVANLQVSK
jgi:hypothetical protein